MKDLNLVPGNSGKTPLIELKQLLAHHENEMVHERITSFRGVAESSLEKERSWIKRVFRSRNERDMANLVYDQNIKALNIQLSSRNVRMETVLTGISDFLKATTNSVVQRHQSNMDKEVHRVRMDNMMELQTHMMKGMYHYEQIMLQLERQYTTVSPEFQAAMRNCRGKIVRKWEDLFDILIEQHTSVITQFRV